MIVRRAGRWVAPGIAGMLLIVTTGCNGGGSTASGVSAKAPDAAATITPSNGGTKVHPDNGVTVTASSGVLSQVSVRGGGDTAEGALSPDKKTWHSKWALKPGTTYTVTATARNVNGKTTTSTSKFTTLKARSTVKVSDMTPNARETVGIGMPIFVNFDTAIANRAAVERALEVFSSSPTPVEGAWRWMSDQQVVFRPKGYWPAKISVKLVAHLSGVHAGPGTYGAKDYTRTFQVGDSHITKVDLKKTHKSKVYINGNLTKTIPVSGGRGGFDAHGNDFRTTSGYHIVMDKSPEVEMISPNITDKKDPGYYDEHVFDDVHISNSGEYMHRSPGDFECLGESNCSHGCVRQTVAGARWFYKLSKRGDIVLITGTSRKLDPLNGWGFYQWSFDTYVKGSALKKPVMTEPMA